MSKDSSKDRRLKKLSNNSVDLPNFISPENHQVLSVEGTNVIRVPFGVRLSKKKRPQKNQNIATLILPITSVSSPTPPPFVA
tara:strand:+ start:1066 stop:1311 length:246 start_codon:yes stop_codon:yes gene_type:complete